jgi:hypothetical protein
MKKETGCVSSENAMRKSSKANLNCQLIGRRDPGRQKEDG